MSLKHREKHYQRRIEAEMDKEVFEQTIQQIEEKISLFEASLLPLETLLGGKGEESYV